jgi:hypothetical protein
MTRQAGHAFGTHLKGCGAGLIPEEKQGAEAS